MLQHHKQLSLDLDKLLPVGGLQPTEDAASSSFQPRKLRGSAKARVKPLRSSGEDLEGLERRAAEPDVQAQQTFDVDGRAARVSLGVHGIEWTYTASRQGCLPLQPPTTSESVPFQEMLSVQQLGPVWRGAMRCMRVKVFRFMVYTFRRSPQERCVWSPRRIVFEVPGQDVAKDWQAHISAGIARASAGRPQHLLVVMNPNSGARRARTVYERIVGPVFRAAGLKTTLRETQYPGHAQRMMEQLRLEDVQGIDGVVAVGGDGIFHEIFNGMLHARAAAGPELQPLLMQMRVAHIPAGSTDAVACTLHGTRSVFTAAMHIVLGDRTELDILRVDTKEGATHFASCIAAYGFMGDVMSSSEGFRWMGPVRYDVVGAAKLLANNTYRAKVSYLKGDHYHGATASHSVCNANCPVCRSASFYRKNASPSTASLFAHSHSQHSSPAASPSRLAGLGAPAAAFSLVAAAGEPGAAGASAAALPFEVPVLHEPASALLSGGSEAQAGLGMDTSPSRRGQQQQQQQPGEGSDGSVSGAGGSTPRGQQPQLQLQQPQEDFLQPATSAHERHSESWRVVEGEYVSIMLIVMPCRSEKTKQGMARFGHLADGRLKLVLVKRCSALQYLRFLLTMSQTGVFPGQHPYVDVIDAVAVKVECLGRQSSWNLDGELLSTQCLSAEVHQGLLEVFARGVER